MTFDTAFLIVSFAVALACSALLAPLISMISRRLGLVDRPDGHRKLHSEAVPLAGGPTILISAVAATGLVVWLFPKLLGVDGVDLRFLGSLFAASIVIVAVGLFDDRFGLRGRQKLFGQFLAACIMVPSGIMIQRVQVFGVPIEFGDLSALVTLFWILGAVNALNLIDGVDGLACTAGIVLALSIAAVTFLVGGRPDGLLMALVLAGALCGFLIYNFPPARMFLGDSGSMLIGLILGCIALKCSIKQYTAAALVMPTAIWAIPIFDVLMAIVRRKLTGRSIYSTDRAHLHHCLLRQGHSGRRLLLIVGSLCAITGLGAVLSAVFNNELLAIVGVMTAVSLLVVTRSFGYAELTLLSNRLRRFAGSMLRGPGGENPVLHNERVQLHGNHQWEEIWFTLTDFANRFGLDRVELMVTVPSNDEEYHATWRRKSRVQAHEECRSEIPLIVDGLPIGQLRVAGAVGDASICEWMSELIAGLRPFELQLNALVRELHEKKLQRKLRANSEANGYAVPQQVHA